eukprot:scaffold436_cov336-Pavlova_lutheri.AAC.13
MDAHPLRPLHFTIDVRPLSIFTHEPAPFLHGFCLPSGSFLSRDGGFAREGDVRFFFYSFVSIHFHAQDLQVGELDPLAGGSHVGLEGGQLLVVHDATHLGWIVGMGGVNDVFHLSFGISRKPRLQEDLWRLGRLLVAMVRCAALAIRPILRSTAARTGVGSRAVGALPPPFAEPSLSLDARRRPPTWANARRRPSHRSRASPSRATPRSSELDVARVTCRWEWKWPRT